MNENLKRQKRFSKWVGQLGHFKFVEHSQNDEANIKWLEYSKQHWKVGNNSKISAIPWKKTQQVNRSYLIYLFVQSKIKGKKKKKKKKEIWLHTLYTLVNLNSFKERGSEVAVLSGLVPHLKFIIENTNLKEIG